MIRVISAYVLGTLALLGNFALEPLLSFLLSALIILLVGLDSKTHRLLRVLLKTAAVWAMVLVLISWARVAGGQAAQDVISSATSTGTMVFSLLSAIAAAFGLVSISDHLACLDRFRVPRTVLYVFSAVVTILPGMRSMLHRQVQVTVLRLTQPISMLDRFTAYRRVVLPLFVTLLRRQHDHAQSLLDRGFFDDEHRFDAPPGSPRGLLVITVFVALVEAGRMAIER